MYWDFRFLLWDGGLWCVVCEGGWCMCCVCYLAGGGRECCGSGVSAESYDVVA